MPGGHTQWRVLHTNSGRWKKQKQQKTCSTRNQPEYQRVTDYIVMMQTGRTYEVKNID